MIGALSSRPKLKWAAPSEAWWELAADGENLRKIAPQVGILFGAVTWPNEQDIDPETLIAEMLPVTLANPPDAIIEK